MKTVDWLKDFTCEGDGIERNSGDRLDNESGEKVDVEDKWWQEQLGCIGISFCARYVITSGYFFLKTYTVPSAYSSDTPESSISFCHFSIYRFTTSSHSPFFRNSWMEASSSLL